MLSVELEENFLLRGHVLGEFPFRQERFLLRRESGQQINNSLRSTVCVKRHGAPKPRFHLRSSHTRTRRKIYGPLRHMPLPLLLRRRERTFQACSVFPLRKSKRNREVYFPRYFRRFAACSRRVAQRTFVGLYGPLLVLRSTLCPGVGRGPRT